MTSGKYRQELSSAVVRAFISAAQCRQSADVMVTDITCGSACIAIT